MRLRAIALSLVIGLAAASPAQADPLDDAVAALEDAPVYVAPGTEGVSPTTASSLTDLLREGDNIAIVMLPASAGEAGLAASEIDKALGSKRIVAVSVGDQLAAASSILSVGLADDLMRRAVNVSTSPVETLQTFIRNTHTWQSRNPQAPASKPTQKDDGSLVSAVISFVCAVLAILLALVALRRARRRTAVSTPSQPSTKFQHSPDKVKELLKAVMGLRKEIQNAELVTLIEVACADTEEYFRRSSNKREFEEDAQAFETHIEAIKNVLKRYVDIQNFPRYYDTPEESLRQGHYAVDGYAAFVLESIRKGRRHELTEFKVDTKILSAQRYA